MPDMPRPLLETPPQQVRASPSPLNVPVSREAVRSAFRPLFPPQEDNDRERDYHRQEMEEEPTRPHPLMERGQGPDDQSSRGLWEELQQKPPREQQGAGEFPTSSKSPTEEMFSDRDRERHFDHHQQLQQQQQSHHQPPYREQSGPDERQETRYWPGHDVPPSHDAKFDVPPGHNARFDTPPGHNARFDTPPGYNARRDAPSGYDARYEVPPGHDARFNALPPRDAVHAVPPGRDAVHAVPPGRDAVHAVPPGRDAVHAVPPGRDAVHAVPPGHNARHEDFPGSGYEHRPGEEDWRGYSDGRTRNGEHDLRAPPGPGDQDLRAPPGQQYPYRDDYDRHQQQSLPAGLKNDEPTISSLRKDPHAAIPGLGGTFESQHDKNVLIKTVTSSGNSEAKGETKAREVGGAGGGDMGEANVSGNQASNMMIQSLGKIVSQLQTLKGITSSLQLLNTLPKESSRQEDVKGVETVDSRERMETELSEETKRKVAALLATESDSDGEQVMDDVLVFISVIPKMFFIFDVVFN